MRRALIIIALVIVLAGLGVVAYFYFFSGDAGVTVSPGATGLPGAGPSGASSGGGATEPAPGGTPGAPTEVAPRLVKISAGPVVPGVAVTSKGGTASTSPETLVHFIERQSGNVFSYSSLSKTLTRISNKTIPGIQSASWLPDASVAFVRYLSGENFSTVNTYALSSSGAGGFFLSQNLADIAVSSTNILTLSSGVNGSSGSVARTDGTRPSEAFTTPLSSIRASFAGKNQYLVYTKPSASLEGDAFLVDSTGRFSRIAGPLEGLVALASPQGKWVLVSYSLDGAIQMKLINTTTRDSFQLPVAAIAEKCAWANDDSSVYCGIPVDPPSFYRYPDDWYQGAAHFADRIWKIDVTGRYAQLIVDFSKEAQIPLDAVSLATDASGTMLVFVNKNDGSLWGYSL